MGLFVHDNISQESRIHRSLIIVASSPVLSDRCYPLIVELVTKLTILYQGWKEVWMEGHATTVVHVHTEEHVSDQVSHYWL